MLAVPVAACNHGTAQQAAAPTGYAFPKLTGRVVDAANVLPQPEEDALSGKLANLETRTRHQLVVATVPSLGGHAIEDYARRLGNFWGIGRKGVNDGVLIVVAPGEQKVRIAVGDGLARQLPDDEAARIIDTDMLPAFGAGQMASGIDRAANDIIADLSRNAA